MVNMSRFQNFKIAEHAEFTLFKIGFGLLIFCLRYKKETYMYGPGLIPFQLRRYELSKFLHFRIKTPITLQSTMEIWCTKSQKTENTKTCKRSHMDYHFFFLFHQLVPVAPLLKLVGNYICVLSLPTHLIFLQEIILHFICVKSFDITINSGVSGIIKCYYCFNKAKLFKFF